MPPGKGRAGAPSHRGLRLASKKTAASSKDEAAEKSTAKDEAKPEAENRTTQASFKRAGKQDELPGVTTGERRSPEIEEAAEHWEDTKLAKAKATKEHQEADDALVAVMRKKNRILYSRSTFGTVKIPETKIHAQFTREKKEPAKKSRKK